MAVADINSLTKPLQSDLVGERGERDYEKPEEKDHFFKWLGTTKLGQGTKEGIKNFFSQTGQLESDTGKKIAGSWANIMKGLRIDEEDSSGKLLKELQEMEDRGEQSWKALLAYPALGEKLLQKITEFVVPDASIDAAEKMAKGEEFTYGEAAMAGLPAVDVVTPFPIAGYKMFGKPFRVSAGGKRVKYGPSPNLTDAATEYLINNPQISNVKARLVFLNEPDKYLKPGITDVGVKTISERKQSLIKSGQIKKAEGERENLVSKERKEDTFEDFKSNLEGIDMKNSQAVLDAFRNSYKKGFAESRAGEQYVKTGILNEAATKKINKLIDEFENTEGGFKILKQHEIDKLKPKKKDASDIYAEYYRKEFSPDTATVKVKKSSEFRFFDNKRRTLDDQTPEEFFSEYSLKDIEKGGKLHNEYLQFKAIDDVRAKNVETVKPILRKIFTKVREGTPKKKKSLLNLNIAHKFEASGIKRGYVSETKKGKGTDPTEIYIDVSEYNQVIQPSMEAEARKLYNRYLEFGDEADYIKLEKIDKDMKALGIEGEIAPGQKIGQAMPFDKKIRQLADEAIDNNFITQKEYDQLINSAEEIAESKIKFFNTFGIKATYAGGGIVGIDYLTRPL